MTKKGEATREGERTIWTHEDMVSCLVRPTFNGFTAARCHNCRKTANVPAGGPSWRCPCGEFTPLSHDGFQRPHERPDYGPTWLEIWVAIHQAKLRTWEQDREFAGGGLAGALFDANFEGRRLRRVEKGELLLLKWWDHDGNPHARVVTPDKIETVREVDGRPVNILHIGGAVFFGGAIGDIISVGKSQFYRGTVATKRYAAIMLLSSPLLAEEKREEFFALIRPGEILPTIEAALEELDIQVEAGVGV